MARKQPPRGLVPQVLPASASPFEPTRLDPMLESAVRTLDDACSDWEALRPMVADFFETFKAKVAEQREGTLKPGAAHQVMQSLTILLERQSRIMGNMAKATDLVARLRSFLSGGEGVAPDLQAKSDRELEAMVLAMAGTIRPEVANGD